MKTKNNTKTLDQFIEEQYGKRGTAKREKFEKGYESFVSQFPIPYGYGLTCGELAKMLNEEGM
jgi:hypothetical protein